MRWFKFIENLIGRKPVAAQIKDISKWEIPICVSEPMWVTDVHLSTNTQKNQSNIDTSIFTPESATNWAKPSVVEEIVKNKVNKILFNDDTAIVSELLKQLMQSNGFKGEVVSRSDISGVWKVTVALNGSIKKGKTVEKICMEILKKFDESKLDARTYHDNEVSFKHFVIEFQDIFHNGKMTFEIKNIKSLTEKEFHMIRDIFEKHVMANSDLESNQRIDEAIIVERLGLKDTDIVIIEEKKMEITAFTEDNTAIELDTLLRLANKLSTKSSCFEDTKFMSIHRDNYGYDLEDPKFNISVTTNQIHLPVEFDLIIKKKAITLVINLPNIGFDRKFLSGIFVPFFKEVRQLVSKKNQESITDYLIWMGVQVREVSEGEDRDLATLYEKTDSSDMRT